MGYIMRYDRKTIEIPIMIIMECCEWKGIPGVLAAWPVPSMSLIQMVDFLLPAWVP